MGIMKSDISVPLAVHSNRIIYYQDIPYPSRDGECTTLSHPRAVIMAREMRGIAVKIALAITCLHMANFS